MHSVLAKTFRPHQFEAVIGQPHVVEMLSHALNLGRLHHAYLFTGTRGVGKTSLARIFAKALNCEAGISATPCDSCSVCHAIDQGRFIDLIEVDAASRTKVEDTRSLLDNVQYAPTQGRFKIYLIDEVHMLSGHSFNALLKTLEEPPSHVKFLLATTDPQKLPVTVLSRCLQLHLKPVAVSVIQAHLAQILAEESVSFEPEALKAIAQSASGSVRDALSLLDQAIAQGAGVVSLAAVRELLGVLDPQCIPRLLQALAEQDTAAIIGISRDIWIQNGNFEQALKDLMKALHDMAFIQSLPVEADLSFIEGADVLKQWVLHFSAEDIQLYYHMAVQGARDLPYAPDSRLGFQMTLLRMALFRLVDSSPRQKQPSLSHAQPEAAKVQHPTAVVSVAPKELLTSAPVAAAVQASVPVPSGPVAAAPAPAPAPERVIEAPPAPAIEENLAPPTTLSWDEVLGKMQLTGMAAALASHCALKSQAPGAWSFSLSSAHAALLNKTVVNRIEQALSDYLKEKTQVHIDVQAKMESVTTPAEKKVHQDAALLQNAKEKLRADPFVQALQEQFEAHCDESSIIPTK